MIVVDNIEELRAARRTLRGRIGLVPTMGALHKGHLSLVEAARADNASVVATIFVNPTQFAAHEDLSKYPRDLPRDLSLFEQAGVDLVFTPTPDLMYPPGFQTWVEVEQVSKGLEGERRPGHFKGVATVVAKLFHLTQPDMAYFGQKDAQQVAVIRRMVRDLNFPLDIVVCPTLREADGLAMSSRNVYLSPEQRAAAVVLYRALQAAADVYGAGETAPETLRQTMRAVLRGEPLAVVDYVSAADARTLQELNRPTGEPVLLSMAARIGTTRLIDNCLLPAELNDRANLTALLGV
jgi:pantoate--beta-alanine ligase